MGLLSLGLFGWFLYTAAGVALESHDVEAAREVTTRKLGCCGFIAGGGDDTEMWEVGWGCAVGLVRCWRRIE